MAADLDALASEAERLYEVRTLAQLAVRRAERLMLDATIDDQPAASARLRAARIECRAAEDAYEAVQRQLRIAKHEAFVAQLNSIRNGAA